MGAIGSSDCSFNRSRFIIVTLLLIWWTIFKSTLGSLLTMSRDDAGHSYIISTLYCSGDSAGVQMTLLQLVDTLPSHVVVRPYFTEVPIGNRIFISCYKKTL